MTLVGSASMGDLEEFVSFYREGDVQRKLPGGKTLLTEALGNPDPKNRFDIASFLLDEGADATWVDPRAGTSLVHIVIGKIKNSGLPESDRELLSRLLDAGADLNAVDGRFGTPVQSLLDRANEGEVNTAPFYEIFFSREGLDLFKGGAFNESTFDSAYAARDSRPILWQHVRQYVVDHGLQVPESERVEE